MHACMIHPNIHSYKMFDSCVLGDLQAQDEYERRLKEEMDAKLQKEREIEQLVRRNSNYCHCITGMQSSLIVLFSQVLSFQQSGAFLML